MQASPIDEKITKLVDKFLKISNKKSLTVSDEILNKIANKINDSSRPVLYVGNGIRLSNSYKEFIDFLEKFPIATVTGWNSNDLIWDDHPCYCGRPGSVGNRAGNFAFSIQIV